MFNKINKDIIKFLNFGILIFFIIIIPIIVFIINFHEHSYSNSTSNWNDFAGYISGTVGTVIAFLNLCILIILTKIANNFQDNENEKQRKFRKKILIAEIRQEEIINISKTLYSPLHTIESYSEDKGDADFQDLRMILIRINILVNRFIQTNKDLFNNIDDEIIKNSIDDCLKEDKVSDFISKIIKDYELSVGEFIKKLRTEMLNDL